TRHGAGPYRPAAPGLCRPAPPRLARRERFDRRGQLRLQLGESSPSLEVDREVGEAVEPLERDVDLMQLPCEVLLRERRPTYIPHASSLPGGVEFRNQVVSSTPMFSPAVVKVCAITPMSAACPPFS